MTYFSVVFSLCGAGFHTIFSFDLIFDFVFYLGYSWPLIPHSLLRLI